MVRIISVLLIILVGLLLSFCAGCPSARADYPPGLLTQAIAIQESKNNGKAVGDKHLSDHAYGAFQIRQPCIDDVNRKFGTHYDASKCLNNRKLSEWVFREYINMYATEKSLGHAPTESDMARIWNGGPQGHKHRSTLVYWQSVRKLLRKLES